MKRNIIRSFSCRYNIFVFLNNNLIDNMKLQMYNKQKAPFPNENRIGMNLTIYCPLRVLLRDCASD